MRYTQSQVRELLGIPLQTYRYWAALIPHLSSRAGKGSLFTTGDILGLALTKEACTSLGLAVGQVTGGLEDIFGILNSAPWPTGAGCVLMLSMGKARFVTVAELAQEPWLEAATLLVPCAPIMEELRARLLPGDAVLTKSQKTLPLFGAIAGGKARLDLRKTPATRLRSGT